MADTKTIVDATTQLINAVEGLVRAASGTQPVVSAANMQKDSPAWADATLGSDKVGNLGTEYLKTHVPANVTEDPNGSWNGTWAPERGATWKDFARIYVRLFDNDQVFSNGQMINTPFPRLRYLQSMLHHYDVNDPAKQVKLTDLSWPTAAGFPPPATSTGGEVSVREAIAHYLSFFNQSSDGSPANRDQDFATNAGPKLTLTHGQCVELHHVFITQEDLRLLAPYDVVFTRVW